MNTSEIVEFCVSVQKELSEDYPKIRADLVVLMKTLRAMYYAKSKEDADKMAKEAIKMIQSATANDLRSEHTIYIH